MLIIYRTTLLILHMRVGNRQLVDEQLKSHNSISESRYDSHSFYVNVITNTAYNIHAAADQYTLA